MRHDNLATVAGRLLWGQGLHIAGVLVIDARPLGWECRLGRVGQVGSGVFVFAAPQPGQALGDGSQGVPVAVADAELAQLPDQLRNGARVCMCAWSIKS